MITFTEALEKVLHHVHKQTQLEERILADFTKLNQAIADLKTLVETKLNVPPPPPPDEQPAVDAATAAVQAISAEIPSA